MIKRLRDSMLGDSSIAANTRRLMTVVFVTILMSVLAFVAVFYHFNYLHRQTFAEIQKNSLAAVANSELSKEIVSLELKIREIVSVVLRAPEQLPGKSRAIQESFAQLLKKTAHQEIGAGSTALDRELGGYKMQLDELLDNYRRLNMVLQDLEAFQQRYTRVLNSMKEDAGAIMVDMALAGKNTDGLQQVFIMLPFCIDEILHAHLMIRTSINTGKPELLGVKGTAADSSVDPSMTALGHITSFGKTLQTLTSSDERVSAPAVKLLDDLAGYRNSVDRLHAILSALNSATEEFEQQREIIIGALAQIDNATTGRIESISSLAGAHKNQEFVATLFLSLVILAVSLAGILISGRISRQIIDTAKEAQLAKESLSRAHEELEIRVRARTEDLFQANVLLNEEIQERKQAEANLAGEKERLSVTLRSIGDGVITTDISGRVVLLNRVAEQLTGWAVEEAVGRPLEEVFHIINERTRAVCENPVTKVVSSGQIVGLANHTALIARDGTERSIADSGSPILDAESRIIGVVLVFRDVTEQLRTEQELVKVKKLESIGVLAGGIAHDFNNILTAILGNLNLALFDRDLKGDTREILAEAEKASIRAKDLTQQLLTFAKGGDPVKEASSLESVIKDSANFILHGDKVVCRYDIPEDLWLVDIDKGQVSQVIQNIVLNASHAMPEGGLITVFCENVPFAGRDLPFAKERKYVKISIRDTGIGIPANVVEKIFDPYFSTKKEGSGLGLAISQSIINKHYGHITVESSPGAGTTFTIYLPASEKTTEQPRELPSGEDLATRARILLMDDEEMVRTVARKMLAGLGHEVVSAADGEEAIRVYQEAMDSGEPFDLAIMDLTIPGGMGGKEAVQEVLKLDPQAKVIVASGYSNDPIMAHCKAHGFSAAISKPFLLQELARVIGQSLER